MNTPAANPEREWPPRFLERAAVEAYRAALWPAAPLVAAWLAAKRRRRPQLARFRPAAPEFESGPIWVHACSVGEVKTSLPLLRALRERWPQLPVLLTTSTATGFALAKQESPVPVAWYPLDLSATVRGFFDRVRPRALLLVETELWPGVLAEAHGRGTPVALVSGRLSDRRAESYRRLRALWRPVVRPISAAAMQSSLFADRIVALGVDPVRVSVTGNIKYDAAPVACMAAERSALRQSMGIAESAPVVVFGSTRPGDEALAARCWQALSKRFPELRMVVAPRHLNRLAEVRSSLGAVPFALRSEAGTAAGEAPIIVLDTLGELGRVYSVATVAVVCGSFYPGVNGHNPIEPAAQGVATVFGAHMGNFEDIAGAMVNEGAAVQVGRPEELAEALAELLADDGKRARVGAAGTDVVRHNRGAVGRTLDFIAPLLEGPGVSGAK